jgi:hypothetical protein
MERFDTLVTAAKFATTRSNSWNFATSDERFPV